MVEFYECGIKTELSTDEKPELDLPEDIPPLRSFYLYLSNSCNLHCRHCWITPTYVNGKPTAGDVIDTSHLRKAVREAKTLGLGAAKFTGGEPMLHPNFRQIASMLSAENLNLTMETNGTLIDREIAGYMKKETTINFISISLDSPKESYHDFFRGSKGAYRAALSGLENLVDAGFNNVQIIMSPHRKNVGDVRELVALAESRGAGSVKLNPVTNNGRGAQMHENDETLGIGEILALSDLVRGELRETAKIPVILNVPPSVLPLSEVTSGTFCGDCGVDHILGILGSGDIALCGIGRTMPEFVYGNIATDSIRDIWLNHPMVVKIRHQLRDFANYPELCQSCIFMRKCRTGCIVQNYTDFGHLIWPTAICQFVEENGLFKNSRKRVRQKGA
jgi:SynChlorMet cassette radical SAM/SPASM protein ScmF